MAPTFHHQIRGHREVERAVGQRRGRQYDALTGQPADRDFPQNSARLSWRWRLREGSAPRKRRKTGLSSRSRVGFAKARDWVVDRTEHKLATTSMVLAGQLADR